MLIQNPVPRGCSGGSYTMSIFIYNLTFCFNLLLPAVLNFRFAHHRGSLICGARDQPPSYEPTNQVEWFHDVEFAILHSIWSVGVWVCWELWPTPIMRLLHPAPSGFVASQGDCGMRFNPITTRRPFWRTWTLLPPIRTRDCIRVCSTGSCYTGTLRLIQCWATGRRHWRKEAGKRMRWAVLQVRVQRKGSSLIRSGRADGYIYNCWARSTWFLVSLMESWVFIRLLLDNGRF